jgi:hypothetical protein
VPYRRSKSFVRKRENKGNKRKNDATSIRRKLPAAIISNDGKHRERDCVLSRIAQVMPRKQVITRDWNGCCASQDDERKTSNSKTRNEQVVKDKEIPIGKCDTCRSRISEKHQNASQQKSPEQKRRTKSEEGAHTHTQKNPNTKQPRIGESRGANRT